MVRRTCKSILVYDPHPHVLIFREFAGYAPNITAENDEDEDNTDYLKSLDQKNWKTNDHYAVLNLRKARFKASDEEVRRKYRQLVLKHHPDKRRGRGEEVKDESHDYFACLTQAIEILGNPTKRNAYDSVDSLAVNESLPTVVELNKDYFATLIPIFLECARWSKHQPIPHFGDHNTPLDLVHRFYDFWDTYETTKDYSFLDEEDKESGEDRDSRRYIERQNRSERARRKAEEQKRIRQILELARENDPRLIAAVRAVREAKEAKKKEKLLSLQKRRDEDEERARKEAEVLATARAASEERHRTENEKLRREKEAAKSVSKKEKKRLRTLCVDQFDHFLKPACLDDPSLNVDEMKLQTLHDIDLLNQALSNDELIDLNNRLSGAADITSSFMIWKEVISRVRKATEAPGLQNEMKVSSMQNGSSKSKANSKWTYEMSQSLIKAVNIFPAGTQKRWEVIAAYVNQHTQNVSVTGKEALNYAKGLRSDDGSLKQEANSKAFDNFSSKIRQSEATKNVVITDQLQADSIRPWTVTEQRALEQALRLHPQVPGEPVSDRWQRIADTIGSRSRKECMIRYKDLAEQIRLKKSALAAANVVVKN